MIDFSSSSTGVLRRSSQSWSTLVEEAEALSYTVYLA